MRIAMLSYHSSPLAALGGKTSGGMNVYVRELSAQLGRMGHQVDVFTRGHGAQQVALADGARLISLPAGPARELDKGELPRYISDFARAAIDFARVEKLKYNLIHAHYWMSGLVGKELKAAWSVPMVLMFHTLGLVKNRISALGELESNERIRGERLAMAAADHVIAATPAERAELQWLYELHSERVSVIAPGVDLQRFKSLPKAEARKEIDLPLDEQVVLFVGRIEALKGIATLIWALAQMAEPKPMALIIGGDVQERFDSLSGEMARLHALTDELGLHEQVQFLGSRTQDELPSYYGAADLVVMPSYSESFGMVALEAMACGRPVIASRVGGLAYLVQDDRTGFHVQEGNAQELALRLGELLGHATLLERMGKAARVEAEKYTWERAAEQIVALYRTMLKN